MVKLGLGRGSGLNNTLLIIAVIGGIGVAAYFLFRNQTGVKESLQSFGDALKSTVDAGNTAGDYLGRTVKRAEDFDIKSRKKEAEVGEGLMNFGYQLQQIPGSIFNTLNNFFDADRAKDFADSAPLRKLLNPPNAKPRVTNNKSLDDLISDATKGRAFRPYPGTAGRPYG